MSIVYLGTSAYAAAVLERLAASAHRPALVVSRPDRPAGRGRRTQAAPVAEAARTLGLPLDQPASVNDEEARARIAAAGGSEATLVVCAFGALIRAPLLDEHEILNVHPSLLPRWRGAAPVERAIMAGDERTGVSIMRLTVGLDSGPVGAQAIEPIAPDDTYGTLAPRLEQLGADLLLGVLDERPAFVEQEEAGATYADKISAEDRTLRADSPAVEGERTVRALHPHIGARAPLADGAWLGVLGARAHDAAPLETMHVAQHDGRLFLGALELLEVQPPGGRPMDSASLLRGRGLPGT
ncbi:MAG TPA: methionyl-tRNA formyltransferase [Solirubrobacteraceae bacterium]|nr:methionyl-tRNA formyltransferase [Solirubrobacteraceae bacterium]